MEQSLTIKCPMVNKKQSKNKPNIISLLACEQMLSKKIGINYYLHLPPGISVPVRTSGGISFMQKRDYYLILIDIFTVHVLSILIFLNCQNWCCSPNDYIYRSNGFPMEYGAKSTYSMPYTYLCWPAYTWPDSLLWGSFLIL